MQWSQRDGGERVDWIIVTGGQFTIKPVPKKSLSYVRALLCIGTGWGERDVTPQVRNTHELEPSRWHSDLSAFLAYFEIRRWTHFLSPYLRSATTSQRASSPRHPCPSYPVRW